MVEQFKILIKSDISKEDLIDSIAYLKVNILYIFLNKKYNMEILNTFIDMLLQFDLIYADSSKQFTKFAKEFAGKMFEDFKEILGKCIFYEDVEYFSSDKAQEEQLDEKHHQQMMKNMCHLKKLLNIMDCK